MKKTLVIFVLLVAFNIAGPDTGKLISRQRHLIEYAQENHTKSLSENEVLKNKAMLYLRLMMIVSAVDRAEGQTQLLVDSS